MNKTALFLALGLLASSHQVLAHGEPTSYAWNQFEALLDVSKKMGPRLAGTNQEREMGNWLTQQWTALGYQVQTLPFEYKTKKGMVDSSNLVVDIKGTSDKILVVGAHYDSTGAKQGSLGILDNGSGMVALLALANELKGKTLPFSVRLIAFGAEENGLKGSKAYVNRDDKPLENVVAMINLDTIIGGDKLYVHSPLTKPYKCDYVKDANFESSPQLRESLRAVSTRLYDDNAHLLHDAFKGYPQGETGSWSDHAPFACNGIQTAYLEATNFAINGKNGNDGFSQIADKEYWTCFDEKKIGSCDRKQEKQWGEIWHTKFDHPDFLIPKLEPRLKSQLDQNVNVLASFVLEADKWIK
jgi:hypothetical protein